MLMKEEDVAIMNKTREALFDRVEKSELTHPEICEGFSRHTLWRFFKGGDIRLSIFLSVLNKVGYKLMIIKK